MTLIPAKKSRPNSTISLWVQLVAVKGDEVFK
jgi:hypothetical protein